MIHAAFSHSTPFQRMIRRSFGELPKAMAIQRFGYRQAASPRGCLATHPPAFVLFLAAPRPSTFEELLDPLDLTDKYCAAFTASGIPIQVSRSCLGLGAW